VQEPDAYLSPDWYGVPDQVLTWTYTHLSGHVRALPAKAVPAHLKQLSVAFEGRLAPKALWRMEKVEPHRVLAMMRAILDIKILVPSAGFQAQRKLIQHKGEAEHRCAIARLSVQPDPAARAIAALTGESLAARRTKKGP
jgi:transcriptional regulator